jgi:hypothetical protein
VVFNNINYNVAKIRGRNCVYCNSDYIGNNVKYNGRAIYLCPTCVLKSLKYETQWRRNISYNLFLIKNICSIRDISNIIEGLYYQSYKVNCINLSTKTENNPIIDTQYTIYNLL